MIEPSASITTAVLWYSPAARFSNTDATTTALYFRASRASASVDGPGIDSASAKNRWSSAWQKYCERNSSWVQKMRAPTSHGAFRQQELPLEVRRRVGPARHLAEADPHDTRR